jgi:DNA-binding CsgD family transcriptional regulator
MVNDGEQSLWISHGYKGVFRPLFNETYDSVVKVDFYNSNHGFPSDKNIIVFEISGRPVFTTGQGIYRYDAQSDSFVPDALLSTRLTRTDMNILREDEKGNIWYFTDTELGVFRLKEDGNYNEVVIPFKELKQKFIKWFQFVYPYNDNNVLIGTQNGFAHYTSIYFKNYKQPFSAFIRNVQILSRIDSVIYRGSPSDGQFSAEIPYRFNHLQFEFAANDFENPDQLRFLTKLKGFDKDWVEWKNSTSRQFTNLRHGNYTFEVKAINVFGHVSNPAEFTFQILPPWYLSMYAYFGYAVLFLLLIFMIAKYIRYRIERSKKAYKAEQQKHFEEREKQLQIESLLAEQEVSKLRNEKLQTEKIQKDKELANITMQIIQRSKSLSAIKRDLRKLVREMGDHPAINQINMINKRINRSIDTDKQWEVFESHFENVHEEFLKRLKEKYPDLTPREMKLCAYLRLNISSKEIANLMNISTRGVEISRYRLRKKLNLEHDINLTEFIMGF